MVAVPGGGLSSRALRDELGATARTRVCSSSGQLARQPSIWVLLIYKRSDPRGLEPALPSPACTPFARRKENERGRPGSSPLAGDQSFYLRPIIGRFAFARADVDASPATQRPTAGSLLRAITLSPLQHPSLCPLLLAPWTTRQQHPLRPLPRRQHGLRLTQPRRRRSSSTARCVHLAPPPPPLQLPFGVGPCFWHRSYLPGSRTAEGWGRGCCLVDLFTDRSWLPAPSDVEQKLKDHETTGENLKKRAPSLVAIIAMRIAG